MADEREDRIRQRAYEIWEREGRPEGREERHWDAAKEEISIEESQGQATRPNPSAGPQDTSGGTEPVEEADVLVEMLSKDYGPTKQTPVQKEPRSRSRRVRTQETRVSPEEVIGDASRAEPAEKGRMRPISSPQEAERERAKVPSGRSKGGKRSP